VDPTPELPDDTLIANVRFPTRIRNVLAAAGLKTVGDVRETTDETLLSLQDLGRFRSNTFERPLGLPSRDGVRSR
jgi:DNA-directed RNA polymerase alpha subunit